MAESKTLLEKLVDKANWIFTFLAAVIPTIAAISAGSIENIFKQENAFRAMVRNDFSLTPLVALGI